MSDDSQFSEQFALEPGNQANRSESQRIWQLVVNSARE